MIDSFQLIIIELRDLGFLLVQNWEKYNALMNTS